MIFFEVQTEYLMQKTKYCKAKNGRAMVTLNYAVCNSKKLRVINKQEACVDF